MMVPRAEIPRSTFRTEWVRKQTFDSGWLVPIMVKEILPGDHIKLSLTAFCRLATPLFPVMDNLHLETFFFFCPNRLVWDNWVKMMGEQTNPGDSIAYTVPQQVSPASGYAALSLQDYMMLPTVGVLAGGATKTHSALPLRMYNLIWNEFFRDENLQNSLVVDKGNGPDTITNYVLRRRNKTKDYFTGALPAPQKGAAVTLPLGTTAPVMMSATTGANFAPIIKLSTDNSLVPGTSLASRSTTSLLGNASDTINVKFDPNGTLYTDLSAATAATISQIRTAFQVQKLLERDARGGTRYVESLAAHFGVNPEDFRMQRPEYLGGGHSRITINPIAQTSATNVTGGTTPQGNLAAMGTALASGHYFNYAAQEHGYIIGIAQVRADLTYQQGLHKHWSRTLRYDFYYPVFANLSEQAILNQELYVRGDANDTLALGYIPRWDEYRMQPSEIAGLMRSTHATPIDQWHYAQKFTALPTLGDTFIQDNPPVQRTTAVGAAAAGQELLFDGFFQALITRAMPVNSVPGQIDRF